MGKMTTMDCVLVPVSDQDAAIAFYTQQLGFTLTADVPFGAGSRWVAVTPPGGGTGVALVPPQPGFAPGRSTGIALNSADPRGDHAELTAKGVDVDPDLMGGDSGMPLMFFFRDQDENQLVVVAE